MLELKNVRKSFGDVRVLNGVSLRMENGSVYTLKGGNGSGKTTLINIISGFLKPDGGRVFYAKSITRNYKIRQKTDEVVIVWNQKE
jgi:branched-chain amino acid transport system ATP-binding protein